MPTPRKDPEERARPANPSKSKRRAPETGQGTAPAGDFVGRRAAPPPDERGAPPLRSGAAAPTLSEDDDYGAASGPPYRKGVASPRGTPQK
jgi:hypothetical protein